MRGGGGCSGSPALHTDWSVAAVGVTPHARCAQRPHGDSPMVVAPLGIGLRGHAGGGWEGPVVMLDLSRLTPRRPPLLRGVPTAGGSFFEEIRGRAALPPETGPLPGSPLESGMGRGPVDALSRSKDVRPYGRRSRIPEDHPSAFGDPDRGRAPAEPVLGLRRAPWACPSGPGPETFVENGRGGGPSESGIYAWRAMGARPQAGGPGVIFSTPPLSVGRALAGRGGGVSRGPRRTGADRTGLTGRCADPPRPSGVGRVCATRRGSKSFGMMINSRMRVGTECQGRSEDEVVKMVAEQDK